jgi:hypothetical protein
MLTSRKVTPLIGPHFFIAEWVGILCVLQINSSLPNKMPTPSAMKKCGPIRGVTFLDVSILIVFYYLSVSGLIRRVAF